MKDKKSFGKYIMEKRKEAHLTQEELANKLYVIPTTISKWERGITYPDITMITNLCKELNISEHEFFMACDDEAMSKEKREIEKYRTIKKVFYYTIEVSYLIAIVTCFICNLLIDHKLSWSLIAFVGITLSFSITHFPFYLKKNKYRVIKATTVFTILVYLLLFVINAVTNGNWLLQSYLISTFVFILLWIDILFCTFTKVDKVYKISMSLLMISICILFTNPLCEHLFNIVRQDDNIVNNICAYILILIAIILSLKKTLKRNK